jgi:Na+/melibiose symporter-like transporter
VEKNRIKISSIQGLFSISAAVLGILLPMIIQSRLQNPQNMYFTNPDGEYLMRILPLIATLFGILSLIFIIFTYVSVDESFYHTDPRYAACLTAEKKSIRQQFAGLLSPFKDKDYQYFLYASICLTISMRMMVRILAPFMTFVLLLKGNEFNYFTIGIIPFAVLGFIFWQKKAKEVGLKKTFLVSTSLMAGILFLTIILLIPMEKITRIVLAFILVSLALYCMTSGYIIPNPTISRLVDSAPALPNEIQGQGNKSGIYFGSYLFSLNIANALGDIIMGLVMTGDNAVNPTILTFIFPISSVFFLGAVYLFARINMERK